MSEFVFKIMGERDDTAFNPIPLRVILPHQAQALTNHMQTLTRLNERGGLDPREALHVLYDLRYGQNGASRRIQNMELGEADRELRAVVRARYPMMVAAEQVAAGNVPCEHERAVTVGDHDGVKRCKQCGYIVVV